MNELSLKERAICACILDALSDKEIARAVPMNKKCVEQAVQRIKRKVGGARNRVELALKLQKITWADGQ